MMKSLAFKRAPPCLKPTAELERNLLMDSESFSRLQHKRGNPVGTCVILRIDQCCCLSNLSLYIVIGSSIIILQHIPDVLLRSVRYGYAILVLQSQLSWAPSLDSVPRISENKHTRWTNVRFEYINSILWVTVWGHQVKWNSVQYLHSIGCVNPKSKHCTAFLNQQLARQKSHSIDAIWWHDHVKHNWCRCIPWIRWEKPRMPWLQKPSALTNDFSARVWFSRQFHHDPTWEVSW